MQSNISPNTTIGEMFIRNLIIYEKRDCIMFGYFDPYRVTLFGHRYIEHFHEAEEKLNRVLEELILKHRYIDFYIGNDGDFDTIATSAIRQLVKRFGKENIAINLVLAYPKANMDLYEEQFDSVIIPPSLYKVHPKAAISERNRWMVENSNLMIAYVRHNHGGAWTALRMAEKMGITTVRI